jgi:Heterokaryon incompatibility protein (HET)
METTLRYLCAGGITKVIWVDQMCINQFDGDVRSEQVMLMKDIYTRASVVHI